jgi:hypothetical protein
VLRIVCRRLRPRYRLGARNAQKRPSEPLQGRGIYPNPWRPENVALKGSFCVGLLPVPGLLPPLPPLPELPPLPSCPAVPPLLPLLPPRCCPAAGATRCHHAAPPGGTFGMECDGPLGSGPDQPDQPDQHPTNPPQIGPSTKSFVHRRVAPTRPTRPTFPYCFSLLHAYTPLFTSRICPQIRESWSVGRVVC